MPITSGSDTPKLPVTGPNRPVRRSGRAALVAILVAGSTLGGFTAGSFDSRPALAQGSTSQGGPITPQMSSGRLPNFVGLVKQVKPAVVSITSILKPGALDDEQGGEDGMQGGGGMQGGPQQMPFPFGFPFQFPQSSPHRVIEARGSGFIISADGYVVTNNHVVKDAKSVSVTLSDGTTLPAKVIGRDAKTDLALLQIKRAEKFPFIQLGNSANVEPGEWVVAVGNPFGLGGTVTAGIVSALGRNIGDGPYDSFLQVDAPINRGNSGGPLFTQDGKVVGVNTAIITPTGGSVGIGFAIPSNTVREIVAQLKAHGKVTRGFLGVTAQEITPAMAKALSLPKSIGNPPNGALVADVTSDSPAQNAGIKPGDVITAVNGTKITNPRDLAVDIAGVSPGSQAKLSVLRNGKDETLTASIVKLGGNSGSQSGSGNEESNSHESIGVALSALTDNLRQQLGVDDSVRGAVVQSVKPDSAADQAGIRPGDIIVGVGDHAVASPHEAVNDVHAALRQDKTVALRILRDGQSLFVAVSPGSSDQGDQG